MRRVTRDDTRLRGITFVYKGFIRDYWGLQGARRGYRGLQGVTRGYTA